MKRLMALILLFTVLCFSGCASNNDFNKNVNLSDIENEIENSIKLPDMLTVKSEQQLVKFYGIDSSKVDSFSAKINNSGVAQDEIVLVKAKNSDDCKEVVQKLDDRLESKLAQAKNYLPEQYEMMKKCSVQQYGNYITMFVSNDADKMTSIFKKSFT